MNEIIEAIFKARFEVAKTLPQSERHLSIRAHPKLVRELLGEKDPNGNHYVWVDAFDKSKWAICGLKLIEDESIEGFAVEVAH